MALNKTKRNIIYSLFFPAAIVWMELLLHIKIRTELVYSPIYIAFSVSVGLLAGLLPALIKGPAEKKVRTVMLFLLWLIFAAESVAYYILQTFYPPSALGTAAENRLYDYLNIIISTIFKNFIYLILLMLPAIASIFVPARDGSGTKGKRKEDGEEKGSDNTSGSAVLTAMVMIFLAIYTHCFGLWLTQRDWGTTGDMEPGKLYLMDENLDLQVERLGLLTMIRLDVYHGLFPATVIAPSMSDIPVGVDGDGLAGSVSSGPVDRSPQVTDIDLAPFMESTDNSVRWLATYMNTVKPTLKNEYTGMFEGYNVIFLCLEAFSGAGISEELTPTLYKLANECFVFNNFYTPLYYGSTNAGECQNLLGLYPKQGSPMSLQESGRLGTNCYFSLGPQLEKRGYRNIGFHNGWEMYDRERTMENLCYHDWYYLGKGLQAETTSTGYRWPQRDTFMIETTVDEYLNDDVPFNAYYMTISGHTPYSWGWIASEYREKLEKYDWSESTKQYVATVMEVDSALEALLKSLEDAGKLDNTLIVAVADHIPYTAVEAVGELRDTNYGTSDDATYVNERVLDTEVYRNTLMMWTGSMKEKVVIDKVCTQVDILPTLLNLLGIEYDSRMLPGSDMLSSASGLVIFYSKSWRSDVGYYNSYTGEFRLKEGLTMSAAAIESYVDFMNKTVECKRDMTTMILATDFYEQVFGG